jgi:integrase
MSPTGKSKPVVKNLLDKWLDSFSSQGTKRTYRAGIRKFMEMVYGEDYTDHEALAAAMEHYIDDVRAGDRNAGDDILLLTHAEMVDRKGKTHEVAPKTVRGYISGVRDFFEANDITLNGRQAKILRRKAPTTEALTDGRAPTKTELIKVLSHADVRMRAIILFITASGTRLEETLSIDINDVRLDENPIRVCVRAAHAKGKKHGRETFLTDEAANALREWLKVRDEYFGKSRKRHVSKLASLGLLKGKIPKGVKSENLVPTTTTDLRVFPYSKGFISRQWQEVAKKAGIYEQDESTNHGKITLHSLRKYLKVQLLNAGMGEFGEFLLGHVTLANVYNKMAFDEKRKTYLKHQAALMTSVDGERYQKDVVETQGILADQKKALDLMDTGSKALRAQINVLEGENQKLQGDLEIMKKEIAALKEERKRKVDISAELRKEMEKDPLAVLRELENIIKNKY